MAKEYTFDDLYSNISKMIEILANEEQEKENERYKDFYKDTKIKTPVYFKKIDVDGDFDKDVNSVSYKSEDVQDVFKRKSYLVIGNDLIEKKYLEKVLYQDDDILVIKKKKMKEKVNIHG